MLANLHQRLAEIAAHQQSLQSEIGTHHHVINPPPSRPHPHHRHHQQQQSHHHHHHQQQQHQEHRHHHHQQQQQQQQLAASMGHPHGPNNNYEPVTEQKLDTAMNLIRKTIDFVKSEYELDLIILTSFSPRCGGTNPSHHANPLLSFSNSSGGAPEASPCAGYYSSSGVAADFLHTPAGKHVITCWHQFCSGNAMYNTSHSQTALKSAFKEEESQPVSLILPVQVRPNSVSPSSSIESGESLDSNENMVPSHSSRKRPKNFLVNSLMTATNQMTKRRRASISQSDSLKSSEGASPMTSSRSDRRATSVVSQSDSTTARPCELTSQNNVFENLNESGDNQVLDLSTNNTPTTPPPELEHPSDAFGLLAAIKEEENMISPDKLKRHRDTTLTDNTANELDSARLPKSEIDELLSASRPAGESVSPPRTRDELKNFIRAHGPIKKRSASLTSDSDCYRRQSFTTSSLVRDDPDFLASSSGLATTSASDLGDSSKQSTVAGTLMSSTPPSSDSAGVSDSDALWSCPKCSKVMKKKCSYRHIKEVHGANREIVQCPVCYRSFTRKYTLVLHCRNVHPHLEVTNATEFPTRPVEEIQREQMNKKQHRTSRLKSESRDDVETPDSAFSGSEISSGNLSRNSGTPNELLESHQAGTSGSGGSSSLHRSTSEAQLLLNKHLTMLAKSPNTAQQLLGALKQEQQILTSLKKSPQRASLGIDPSTSIDFGTRQSPLHQETSRAFVEQGLLNPHFNSLELSLKLAQLERNQQMQLEFLANSSENN